MAVYIGTKKVTKGGKGLTAAERQIASRSPQGRKELFGFDPETVPTKQSMTVSEQVMAAPKPKVAPQDTQYATPTAARVLQENFPSEAKKTMVTFGKHDVKTELSPQDYAMYQASQQQFYKQTRRPEPIKQTITLTNAPKTTLTAKQEAEFRGYQEAVWKAKATPQTEFVQKDPSKYEFFGGFISFRDPIYSLKTKGQEFETKLYTKLLGQERAQKVFDFQAKAKLFNPTTFFMNVSPTPIDQAMLKQPEPTSFKGKIAMRIAGAGVGAWEQVYYKPTKVALTFGGGAAVGAATKGVTAFKATTIAQKATKVSLISSLALGTGVYAGGQIADYVKAPTSYQKGKVIGVTGTDVGAFSAGASATRGSGFKVLPKVEVTPKRAAPKSSFRPDLYNTAKAIRTGGKTSYVATEISSGKTVTLSKQQFGKVSLSDQLNKLRISGKKGQKGLTGKPKSDIEPFRGGRGRVGILNPRALTKPKARGLGKLTTGLPTPRVPTSIVTRPSSLTVGIGKSITTKPKTDIILKRPSPIVRRPKTDIVRIRQPTRPFKPRRPTGGGGKLTGLPGLPLFGLPKIGGGGGVWGYNRRGKIGSGVKQYQPSLTALGLNIKGKVKKGKFTGLEFRPIPI